MLKDRNDSDTAPLIGEFRMPVRRPFDFLLNGLAADCGARTICVVPSGSLDDGSVELKVAGGSVIVQDPEEAGFDCTPGGAILTRDVDFIVPTEEVAPAIAKPGRSMGPIGLRRTRPASVLKVEPLSAIIDLVRDRTARDFIITQAFDRNAMVVVHSGPITWDKQVHVFDIEARPVRAARPFLCSIFSTRRKPPAAAPGRRRLTLAGSASLRRNLTP